MQLDTQPGLRRYGETMTVRFAKQFFAAALLGALCLPAKAAEIRLAFAIADDIFLAPVFAAEKLGYFQSADIQIRRLNLFGAERIQQALKSGQADIIDVSGPAAAQAFPAGAGGKIIATASNGFYGWTVIVREENAGFSIADLAGKTLAISSTHSLSDMAAQLVSEKSNIRFEIIPLGAGSIVPELRAGKIGAVLSSALLGLREVSASRAQIILELGGDTEGRLVSAYAASTQMIETRPADLRAFLNATFQALTFMQSDRKWSVDLLKEYARISDTGYAERIYDNVIRAMSSDPATDAGSLRTVLALAARAWKQPELADVDPATLYTNEFVMAPAASPQR